MGAQKEEEGGVGDQSAVDIAAWLASADVDTSVGNALARTGNGRFSTILVTQVRP